MPQVTLRLVTIENYHEIIPKYITEKEIIISDYDDMTNCILQMIREGYCFNMDKNLLRGFLEDLTYMFSPNDDKNKLDWHQDFCSSEHVLDHRNGLVAWIPLVDTDEKNGTIIICPKSHNELNAKDMIVNERIGANHSEYLFFPDSIANKYEKICVDTKIGDVIFVPLSSFGKGRFFL